MSSKTSKVSIVESDSQNWKASVRNSERRPAKGNIASKECLDVVRYRAQYKAIRTRIWQNHFHAAYELSESLENAEKQQSRHQTGAIGNINKNKPASVELSKSTTEPLKPEDMTETKPQPTTAIMKRLGLVKEDVFTGVEADALKKLLKTLRWKTWNPGLYFHIRFFSIRNKLHPMSEETKALVRVRWHFILRMLKTMGKIGHALAARSLEDTESCTTYIDMVEASIKPICWGNDPNLCFDKEAYKVHANTMLSIDAQEMLRDQLPEQRTPQAIDEAVLSMQYVNDFAKMPSELQYQLVKAAYTMCVESNRVILRQGHIPQNYYFVLLGQAVSKRFLADGKTETTAILRKGDGFGGAAIFNKCRRLTTVVSQTPVHLLVVPKDMIAKHFDKSLHLLYANVIQFLSKMWFMQAWPLEHLIKCPHQCKRKTFRRTEIIEIDGAKAEWIYVVARGAFRVYQRLAVPRKDRGKVSTFVPPHIAHTVTGKKKVKDHSQSQMSSDDQGATCRKTIYRKSISEKKASVFAQHLDVKAAPSQSVSSSTKAVEQVAWHFVDRNVTPANKAKHPLDNFKYKWMNTKRYLDVFGLEDLCLDPKHPPVKRNLILISDKAECVMVSKNFYLQMASPQLRKKVYGLLMARKKVFTQITSSECSLIPLGGIHRNPKSLQDPIDPEFCIHC